MWSAFTPHKWMSIKLLSIVVNKHSFTDYMIDTWLGMAGLPEVSYATAWSGCYLEACPMLSDMNEHGETYVLIKES